MADHQLTGAQLTELRRALLDKRRELVAKLDRALPRLAGGAEAEAEEMDQVQAGAELDETARRGARDSDLLDEIERALSKLDDGRYGVSELSGEAIGYERLRAMPWARLTAREQEAEERERSEAR